MMAKTLEKGGWHVDLFPEKPRSAKGQVARADPSLWFRGTLIFCRMFTGWLNLLGAILIRCLRLSRDVGLFLSMRNWQSAIWFPWSIG